MGTSFVLCFHLYYSSYLTFSFSCVSDTQRPSPKVSSLPLLSDFLVLLPNFLLLLNRLKSPVQSSQISPVLHTTPLASLFPFSPLKAIFLSFVTHSILVQRKEGGYERCSVTLIKAKCVLSTRKHRPPRGMWEQANVQEIKWGWMRRCSEIILESREKWLHWQFAIVSIQVPSKSLDWSTQMEGVLSVISLHWQNEN